MKFIKTIIISISCILLIPHEVFSDPWSPSQVCSDQDDWVDAKGMTCNEWYQRDCTRASEEAAYTTTQEFALLQHCPESCKTCRPFESSLGSWLPEDFQSRIIGGKLVAGSGKSFPWFVSLGYCGGSLVAPDVVLSAAHCEEVISPGAKVLVGALKQNSEAAGNAQFRRVISTQVHPRFNPNSMNYDLMLIKIQAVSKPHLKPIRLTSKNPITKPTPSLTVIGMGALNANGTLYKPDLRYVEVSLVDHDTCNAAYGGDIDRASMLCASSPGKDSCYGDSGGPIFNRNMVQMGVVSWGEGCGQLRYPGVYARTSTSYRWLKENICKMSDHTANLAMCRSNQDPSPPPDGPIKPPVDDLRFKVITQFDAAPKETSWVLQNRLTNETVMEIPARYRAPMAKTRRPIPLRVGGRYRLTISDPNGMTEGIMGYVQFQAYRNDELVWTKQVNGNFKGTKVTLFNMRNP